MELKQGTLLQGGKYIIKRVLGQGGFGITYLAEQVMLKREVAVKEFFMKESCERDAQGRVTVPTTGSKVQVERYRAKFLKEAETMASLDHPNIVSVIDVFNENGTVYYVMPFMKGGSLSDLVKSKGRLPEERALRYVAQIASALKYMHEQRHLCHFDVKPANILLNAYDNAMLIDFGISKNYDSNGNETSSTPVGKSAGFAPLEQYQEMVNEFSPASDIYALGATLYYLVMGRPPFSAIDRVQGKELEFLNGTSDQTRLLIEQSMELQQSKRLSDLDNFLLIISGKQEQFRDETIIHKKKQKVNQSDRSLGEKSQSKKGNRKIKGQMILGIIAFLAMIASSIFLIIHYAPTSCTRNEGNDMESARDSIIQAAIDDMVRVDGGAFIMGAKPTNWKGYEYNYGRPERQVTLSDYYIGKFEVTQGLWQVVMDNNPSRFTGDINNPVENVSWEDCQEFVRRLNEITKKNFRLPTDAEWEFAARGGNRSKDYSFSGSYTLSNVAWYDYNSEGTTHPVGQKAPNELGLYDMSGNVWEWCKDEDDLYPSGLQTDQKSRSSCSCRVTRGGSWFSDEWQCRLLGRGVVEQWSSDDDLGLRLVMDAE